MDFDQYIVDAFTAELFKGNSAAIVPIDDWLDEALMQNIAVENNLSETAFIKLIGPNHYEIRWFSPLTEIDFCGHATLASAFVIFNQLGGGGDLIFSTLKVGDLKVQQLEDGRIEMIFPNQCPQVCSDVPPALLKGLSIAPKTVLLNRQAYFAVYSTADDVNKVQYQSELLKTLAPLDVVVTGPSEQYDFISRYFWPASGGDEDPVTGSIHSGLAPYWANSLGKNELIAYQASKRGGVLYCKIDAGRVLVSGHAVLYSQAKIFV
ncbi:PhzF family phenazine biosynthesis protein [Alginatibacterium sediminis]|uniref:PhzF family phenazine biosynthesis protein n=1 Tax=Alginatibacterium sediminis TaxID=2164068 RepID=A0A420E9T8_9ALTE|nr:PhzF family phenazine biosynthesis protein [Alginatibacterium sediminis]RKF17434.1 PhzF family phenazine biosynthesis protein [Alginatibacterium sediminis]